MLGSTLARLDWCLRALVDGVPSEAINLEAIPRASFGRSLILDRADDLTFSLRSALWPGNDALGEYAKQEWSSVFIARSPRGGSRFVQPLDGIAPTPSPPLKRLTSSEVQLRVPVAKLGESITSKLKTTAGLTLIKSGRMQHVDVDRDRCLRDGMYSPFQTAAASRVNIRSGCFGETSDCAYAISDTVLQADSPFVAVFVGADHRRLRNSAFSNIAVYHSGGGLLSAISAGNVKVVAYADDRMWRRNNENIPIFAHAFASEGFCSGRAGQVLVEIGVPCVEVAAAQYNEAFFISRDYMDPNTGTAPNAKEMLETSVLYFA